MTTWHRLSIPEALTELGVDPQKGLADEEAAVRLQKIGPNELVERGTKSPWRILLEQLTGVMTVVLIVSAVISLALNDLEDAIAILAIVILNTVMGFTQEYRAEKAIAALKKMAVPRVRVRRGGRTVEISARSLVPGDLVMLEAGSQVPADGRLVESANLRIQEAVLTGESEPVEKLTEALAQEKLPTGDQRNRAFMGTTVTYGRGLLAITETGMQTELGRIAEMIQTVGHEATPLQRRLDQLARWLALAALAVVGLVFLLGLLRGEELRLMFLTAISLAVAAVPEGLPTVVTIGLALGAQRMLRRRALIRKLPAVETLGSVTVICSDKTGTLTENRMTVTLLDVANHQLDLKEQIQGFSPTVNRDEADPGLVEHPAILAAMAGGALCNDALLEPVKDHPRQFASVGDPTEGALVIAAARAGLWKNELENCLPRVAELPFDSERKRMTTLHSFEPGVPPDCLRPVLKADPRTGQSAYLAFTKGAVDGLLDISKQVWVDGRVLEMDDTWHGRIQQANNRLAQNGMRVLGVAYRLYADVTGRNLPELQEDDLVFIGLVGMIDPARPEVYDAVQTAHSAGVRTIMITGDHPLTALYIARQLGITTGIKAFTGIELAEMAPEQLKKVVNEASVFARVSPEHKLKIVQALQANGQVVSMTGDGVNDAPALKKADIGVAMGITGTDVSKESADMVLLDDNFATIVAAVEEGRRIYENIRKFIRYALGSNIGEILVMLVAPFLGMPMPLLPLQILWVNLVTDGLPGLALTVEAADKDTMRRPPYPPGESLFGRGLGRSILTTGALLALVTVAVGYFAWAGHQEAWQTMAFTTLTLAQMGNVLALRSGRESVFRSGLFSNPLLTGAVLLTFLLQLGVIYLPFLQPVFETEPLTLTQLLVCLAASLLIFFAVEVEKWFLRRGK